MTSPIKRGKTARAAQPAQIQRIVPTSGTEMCLSSSEVKGAPLNGVRCSVVLIAGAGRLTPALQWAEPKWRNAANLSTTQRLGQDWSVCSRYTVASKCVGCGREAAIEASRGKRAAAAGMKR
eukprot:scaffold318815_cov41-Tisochrysis_lutea.AAC.1